MNTPFPHTVVDESLSATEGYYTLLRIVHLGPHTVRVRVHPSRVTASAKPRRPLVVIRP